MKKNIIKIIKNNKRYILLIFILLLILVGYFLSVRFFYPELSDRGFFGDMFGGISAVFSGLAFIGIIYTIVLQREELQLQRKELELTRKELKRSAQAQEKSERALSKQAESLKQTAILNGLGAILGYESMLIEVANTGRYGNIPISSREETEKIKKKIETIIEEKS
jgi:uncharacterized membrane protein YedE/YeeE